MPASKINYLVLFKGDSQVYGIATKSIALSTPPPEGYTIEDKEVLFVSMEPEKGELIARPLPREEVLNAELKHHKKKKKDKDE